MKSLQNQVKIYDNTVWKNYPVSNTCFVSFTTDFFNRSTDIVYTITFIIPGVSQKNPVVWYYDDENIRDIDAQCLTNILNSQIPERAFNARTKEYDKYLNQKSDKK